MSRRRRFEKVEPFKEYTLKTRKTGRGLETTTKKVRLDLPNVGSLPPSSAEPSPAASARTTPGPGHINLPGIDQGAPLGFEFTFDDVPRTGKASHKCVYNASVLTEQWEYIFSLRTTSREIF